MTIEDKLNAFTTKLNRQVADHDTKRERALAELLPLFRQAGEKVARRRAQQFSVAASPGPTPPQARVSLGQQPLLQQLDQAMWAAFDLESVWPAQSLSQYPVVYCDTPEEFFTLLLADEDTSEAGRQRRLQKWLDRAEAEAAQGGGIFGVNLPGRGCYLNGWLFGHVHGLVSRAALQDAAALPAIIATACHEKLGHGFIAELTAIGQEKRQLGLWRFDLARNFGLRRVDTPRSALLRQKHALLFKATQFTEEGWATWIEQLMLWLAARRGWLGPGDAPEQPPAKYSLGQVEQVLQLVNEQVPEAHPQLERLGTALHLLLVEDEPLPPEARLAAMLVWQTEAQALDAAFEQVLGQPSVYVLGYLLLQRLEARLGWQNLPLAVALAANVTYELADTPVTDLERLLVSDPRLNVDTRLALLGGLDLAPDYDRAALLRHAREDLGFAVPEGWPVSDE